MKSSEFITEDEVSPYSFDELSIRQAVALLNAKCSQSIVLINHPIWRGMRNHKGDILTIDPSTGVRRSTNTSNHYTELMDNSPYFKGWPKRSKSLICSTDPSYANGYGSYNNEGLYAIFPYDGVKIAICPHEDIWQTEIEIPELYKSFDGSTSMDAFNSWLEYKLGLPDNYEGMVSYTKLPNFATRLAAESRARIKPEQVIPVLQKALSPAKAGFRLMTPQQFVNTPRFETHEIWIGGPVVAMQEELYKKFVSAVAARNKKARSNENK